MGAKTVVAADQVRTIAVVGAGTMGHGIAQVGALAGYAVVMHDGDAEALARGRARIEANLDKRVASGKLGSRDRDAALARLETAADVHSAAARADVVIEAVPENLELKRRVFAELDAVAPDCALLATNTSSLSVAAIASATARPDCVVGMHFFNPVPVMKLVEVVRHAASSDAAVACARALGERLGKTTVVVMDAPGFASSRLGLALGLEAMRMVEQGVASATDIDTAMKLGYGHPMGPLELTDLVGLDVRLHIADYLTAQLGEAFRPPDILRQKVAAGDVGKKSGRGFYRWVDGRRVD